MPKRSATSRNRPIIALGRTTTSTLCDRAVEAVAIPIIASLNGTTDQGLDRICEADRRSRRRGDLSSTCTSLPTDLSLTGREVEQRYLDILRAVTDRCRYPGCAEAQSHTLVAVGHMAKELDRAGG